MIARGLSELGRSAFHWTYKEEPFAELYLIDEDHELEGFVAGIPGLHEALLVLSSTNSLTTRDTYGTARSGYFS